MSTDDDRIARLAERFKSMSDDELVRERLLLSDEDAAAISAFADQKMAHLDERSEAVLDETLDRFWMVVQAQPPGVDADALFATVLGEISKGDEELGRALQERWPAFHEAKKATPNDD
jgi:hypothetical protein